MMKKSVLLLLGFAVSVGASSRLAAEDKPAARTSPKVLQIFREEVKTGKGAAHEKFESRFPAMFARAQWPANYVALASMTGPGDAWFMTGYESFAAWQQDGQNMNAKPALQAEMDSLVEKDAEFLSGGRSLVTLLREDLSHHMAFSLGKTRYVRIITFRVRPGHESDFEEAVKLIAGAYDKASPDTTWVTYQVSAGMQGPTYFVFLPVSSLAEVDALAAMQKSIRDAEGEEGVKRLAKIAGDAYLSTETNVYQVKPAMSYVSKETAAVDPEFWTPKPKMAPAPKAAPKVPAEKKVDSSRSVQERRHAAREGDWTLRRRDVAAARQDLESRVRELSRETLARGEREDAVMVAPQDERLLSDPPEVFLRHDVLPGRDRRHELHELGPVPAPALVDRGGKRYERMPEDTRVDARREEPAGVGEARRDERKRGGEEIDRRGRVEPCGVHEDETPDEARVPPRHVESHGAAQRVAEEVHRHRGPGDLLDPLDDDIREEADAVVHAHARRLVARAMTQEIERQDPAPACQERQRERPFAVIGSDAVQENKWGNGGACGANERPGIEDGNSEAPGEIDLSELEAHARVCRRGNLFAIPTALLRDSPRKESEKQNAEERKTLFGPPSTAASTRRPRPAP